MIDSQDQQILMDAARKIWGRWINVNTNVDSIFCEEYPPTKDEPISLVTIKYSNGNISKLSVEEIDGIWFVYDMFANYLLEIVFLEKDGA